MDHFYEIKASNVFTVERIPLKAKAIPNEFAVDEMSHLEGVQFLELKQKSIGLLTVLDMPELFPPIKVRSGETGEPDAIRTVFGWRLFETTGSPCECVSIICSHVSLLDKYSKRKYDLHLPRHKFVHSWCLNIESSRED